MSVGAHLIHKCDIKRPSAPNQTSHKGNRKVMTTVVEGEPCRLVEKSQRVTDSATGEAATLTTYVMLFPPTADVQRGDQITNILDEQGDTIMTANDVAASYRIESLLTRRGRSARHKSAQLERVG